MDGLSSVSVGNSAASQVVRAELNLDLVPGEDSDVVLPHLPGDGGQNAVAAFELHPEHRAREGLDDLALSLDLFFFLRHSPQTNRAYKRPGNGHEKDGPKGRGSSL